MTIHDILFSLLRLSLGTRADEMDFSVLTNADWKELIDLSFDQGVAAMLVDGIDKATKTKTKTAEALDALDSPELEDLKYEWLSPSGFSSFAPRQFKQA